MGDLERDTRLAGSDGRYRGSVSEDWENAPGRPAGGFLAALALRAAGMATALPRPVSFAVHFVRPARFGEVALTVSTLEESVRTAALRVSMTQSEAPILEGLVRTAADELPGYAVEYAPIPEHPGPEGLPSVTEAAEQAGRPLPRWWNHVEFRSRWREPGESKAPRAPVALSWHRFRPEPNDTDPYVDAGRIAMLAEAMALSPLLFHVGSCAWKLPYFARCVDLSIQFHRDSRKADWLMMEGHIPSAAAGFVHTHSGVWSREGDLVASASSSLLCKENPAAGVAS